MADKVQASNVISEWGFLVLGYEDIGDNFYKLVMDSFTKHGWPYPVERMDVGEGLFRLNPRPYIKTKANKLVAYVGAITLSDGNIANSYLNWSLTYADPGLFSKAIASAGNFSYRVFQEFTFNQINAARAFASILHVCVQEAVDAILDECHVDKTKINRTASGILGGLV